MRTFQLDECTNSKRLQRKCKNQGVVNVRRFPKSQRGKGVKDPQVLQWLAELTTPLITSDAKLKRDHAADVPDSHPGIIVLCSADKPTIRLRDKEALLAKLKKNLADWERIDISNVFVEIWMAYEYDVCVTRIRSGKTVFEEWMRYSDPDWPDCFLRAVSSYQFPTN